MAANSVVKDKGYIGRIANTGPQVVEAPHKPNAPRGKSIIHKGNDLRVKGSKK